MYEREYKKGWLNLTPLHLAIITGHYNSIRVILESIFSFKECEPRENKTDEQSYFPLRNVPTLIVCAFGVIISCGRC